MAKKYKCDVCGKPLGGFSRMDFTRDSLTIYVCEKCYSSLENMRYPGYSNKAGTYLREQLDGENITPAAKTCIQSLLKQYEEAHTPETENTHANTGIEPDKTKEYSNPISATIIGSLAFLCLAVGLIMLLVGCLSMSAGHETLIYFGFGSIISSAFLFVIMNISIDIHHMDYNITEIVKQNKQLQTEILDILHGEKPSAEKTANNSPRHYFSDNGVF